MNREPIYEAVFRLMQDVTGVNTASRRLRHWADVSAAEQPALFMAQAGETAIGQKGLPTKWQISIKLYLYVRTEDPNAAPQMIMNPLLDAIETAFEALPGYTTQTLGIDGVSHAWIDGSIETDEGTMGEQAIAIIPIEILTV